ncbi:hypothetical protein IWW38_004007 [Coemansia aciculifera]|uniref:Uncharacterized protein n=1 Tax=Coemansia aciculifera TaxID=417176 RepID=A0ACC1LZ70_9FUNG|nr:hypothetical protein IWW38_004007 [Coemansia aciculifera]
MVCIICYDLLFGSFARDEPGSSDAQGKRRRIAALSCGHTFHLECIGLQVDPYTFVTCPKCKLRNTGPILTLHTDCDMEHVVYGSGISAENRLLHAELLCNSSLDSAEQQEAKYKALEASIARLQAKLDETSAAFKKARIESDAIHVKVTLL